MVSSEHVAEVEAENERLRQQIALLREAANRIPEITYTDDQGQGCLVCNWWSENYDAMATHDDDCPWLGLQKSLAATDADVQAAERDLAQCGVIISDLTASDCCQNRADYQGDAAGLVVDVTIAPTEG